MNPRSLALLLLALPTLAACDAGTLVPQSAGEEDLVRPVITTTVSPVQADFLSMTGSIAPGTTIQLGFTVPGRLIARNASIGEIVGAGDVLARIDPMALALAVDAANAELRSAEADLENTQATFERQTELNVRGIVSDTVLDLSRLQLQSAQARVEGARAGLSQAEAALDEATLMASSDGIVLAVGGEPGEVLAPGTPVVTLAHLDTRDAIVDIPEFLAPAVAVGDRWTVILEVAPEIQAQGTVREIAPQADPATRTHRVRIELEAPPDAFRLGTTVFARSVESTGEPLFTIPEAAVIEMDGESRVWIVDAATGSVQSRAVEIDTALNGKALVSDGLAAGDIIVTAGTRSLDEGQRVRLLEDH
ncbi:efflux RND transporter periplasmic adaptor subunit [Pelagibacterium luteolum]|uniref:RND family efflux transporter, MFP subunit n=1 Tax=Pelagibacterium luteolum TaxID=440168 RepID=A0A1G7YII6_9HYPH|nr:efflux RND transporter periplasmic adaptor subunit [Pelagibacterium luteolum]SDG96371.1 RND family efflux transporter, MFP subunit [Pelagibacterium luteolum]